MSVPLEIAIFIGGTFLGGVRSKIGSWMVGLVFSLISKHLIKTEHDMALWIHYRNKAMLKKPRAVVQYEAAKFKRTNNGL